MRVLEPRRAYAMVLLALPATSVDAQNVSPGDSVEKVELWATQVRISDSDVEGAELDLGFRPVENVSLRASGTQLFMAPESSEVLIGAGLFDRRNPVLRAETGSNAERRNIKGSVGHRF